MYDAILLGANWRAESVDTLNLAADAAEVGASAPMQCAAAAPSPTPAPNAHNPFTVGVAAMSPGDNTFRKCFDWLAVDKSDMPRHHGQHGPGTWHNEQEVRS